MSRFIGARWAKQCRLFFFVLFFLDGRTVLSFSYFFPIFLIFRLSTEVSIPLDRKDKKTAVKLILDGQISVTPPFFRLIFFVPIIFSPHSFEAM